MIYSEILNSTMNNSSHFSFTDILTLKYEDELTGSKRKVIVPSNVT